ncbi:MAG: hypothetical protein RJQ01_10040 [Microcella sp.]|uniref:hypothetical protein n=1 Tax=Microcella sp. TaxID=1913979 RepID=UPI003314C991
MSRKATRRAERAASLRRRILAAATTAIVGLGLAVGGVTPAMSTPPSSSLPTITGVTFTQENGLTCDKAGYQKPGAMDASSGTFSAPWGSATWSQNGAFSWTIASGYDVDFCVKGSTIVAGIDSSAYNGSSFDFKAQTGHGTSHVGYRIVSTPDPTMIVDCVEISYETQRPLNGADHINVDVVYNGVRGQINLEINENQLANGDPDSTSGFHAFLKFAPAFGIESVKVPISQEQLNSGLLIFEYGPYFTGTWTIEWVQFNSTYFNQDRDENRFVTCGDLPTQELVVPTASMQQITCDADGSYTLDDVEGVVWTVSTNGGDYAEVAPGTYPVATATTIDVRAETESDDYGFAAETQTEWTFGFLEPTDCVVVELPCLPKSAVSYSYYNLSTFTESNPKNSGLITVTAMDGYSDELCKPFWVVAAAWDFAKLDSVWPQTLRGTDPAGDHDEGYIDSVGTYYFHAPVQCGQGDIYASFTSMPYIGTELFGPNNPFPEKFLHNMGFTGPKPTYLVMTPGCNEAEPNEPTATPIVECGTYGSIDISNVENPYVGYTVYRGAADENGSVAGLETVAVGDAKEGVFTVVATAMNGYVFAPGTTTQWEFDLGDYVDCPVTPTATSTPENCLDGDGTIIFGDVDGIASYSVAGIDGSFAPGATLAGLEAGTYSVTAVAEDGSELAADSSPFDVEVMSATENCGVASASVTLPDPDCESGQSWDDAELSTQNASFGTVNVSDDLYVIVATAADGYLFGDGAKTKTFSISLLPADESQCAEATAAVATSAPSCFSAERLDESGFTVSDGVTWSIVDDGETSGSYEVVFTAPSGSRFGNGESTLTATGDLAPALGEEDCVLPVTNAFLAFTDATCLEPQGLDVDGFAFDTELAALDEVTVEDNGDYTVVFTAIGANTTFDQSPDVDVEGREVSSDGKTLTFTGTLEGPNDELCLQLPVIDPFEYVDTCLTATYTLYFVEGLTYWVTVNSDEPFEVVFGENEVSKTFTANPGDYVLATPVANPGYVLDPNQPAPLDRTFNTYPDGCQLPELANWPASATATNEVCTPFGVTSGSITVQFSTGPEVNPNPVRYYLAYGTDNEQELTDETTVLPAGDYVVTAVLTDPEDSLNDSGSDPVSFPLTIGAADESDCDLPTLAITGASNALTGVGIGAVIIILAGLGFVLRRQLME